VLLNKVCVLLDFCVARASYDIGTGQSSLGQGDNGSLGFYIPIRTQNKNVWRQCVEAQKQFQGSL
jgi:hypothetical protein